MKPRKASDLRELSKDELVRSLEESRETLAKNRFQHALSQLQDTSYLKTLRKDIARIETILSEEQAPVRKLTRKKRKERSAK
jgi:large subunit ribosomal protein L29